ncbi:ComEC/Rec2 family competence protein [Actinomyces timonensis]|uniref:ComEC/Rec2 family competence protein n=1 Tax=Actinomyces timonensis TaxID=1288391 RepID=UPI00030B79DA|nr:ComEC/Rec2 family competence protein [Actinomyces timonensis]
MSNDPHPRSRAEPATPALDLRLLAPALAAWACAWAATGLSGARAWRTAGIWALIAITLAAALIRPVTRYRPPRHRHDPRPGNAGAASAGPIAAGALLACLVAAAVLAVASAGQWARARDPTTLAVESGRAVTIEGTISEQPRATASARATTILTALEDVSIDGVPSGLRIRVLGDASWLEMPLGSRVTARGRLRAPDPGASEAAILGRGSAPTRTGDPRGVLGAVGEMRDGLTRATGHAGGSTPGRWAGGDDAGALALVPGLALGDDHALPADLRQDMRTVSMTHLTAVSGQHVVIVLGLVLTGLGVLPRRWRALAGGIVLVGLVLLMRPSGSVLRAATMGAVLLVGVAAGRRSASLPALCAGMVVLLLVDPWQSRDYGFALSVAATSGILLGSGPIMAAVSRRLPRWAAALIAVPVAAQLACAPLLILLQPQVGLWAVPANMMAAPPVPLATVSGLLAALMAPVWGRAAAWLALPALASCAWLAGVARFFAGLPGATIPWPGGIGGALLLAAAEVLLLALLRRRSYRYRRHHSYRHPLYARPGEQHGETGRTARRDRF